MLTTDVALISDPVYMELTKKYAADIGLLEKDFAAAWYKLMSRDMGPATRCVNKDAPPPQVREGRVDYVKLSKSISLLRCA